MKIDITHLPSPPPPRTFTLHLDKDEFLCLLGAMGAASRDDIKRILQETCEIDSDTADIAAKLAVSIWRLLKDAR